MVLAWDRNSILKIGILTQANYINALQFYSTAETTLNKVKGNFSVLLCKKKNPIWDSIVEGNTHLQQNPISDSYILSALENCQL